MSRSDTKSIKIHASFERSIDNKLIKLRPKEWLGSETTPFSSLKLLQYGVMGPPHNSSEQMRPKQPRKARREGALDRFKNIENMRKLASVHASIHDHFNQAAISTAATHSSRTALSQRQSGVD